MTIYQVKPGRTISHGGVDYVEGDRLELSPAHALIHANNIMVVEYVEEEEPQPAEQPEECTLPKPPNEPAENDE